MGHLTYQFRLYPTVTQGRALGQQLETLRQVYNTALAYWKDLYAEEKKTPNLGTLYPLFSKLRNLQIADQKAGGSGPHWLTHVSAVAMRDTLKRLVFAYKSFFRRCKAKSGAVGFPRFKSYGRLTSIPADNYGAGCSLRDAKSHVVRGNTAASRTAYRLDMFGVGRVRVIAHRPIVGTIKTVCVKRDVDGKWYAFIVAATPDATPVPSALPPVGIDVGLEHFLTTSDGEHVPNPRILKTHLKELRRLQRSSSRKLEAAKKRKAKFRECKNLQKSFRKASVLYVRVRNLRKENHRQVTNRLVRKYGTICVESLNVRGMVRNGKLSRAISDAAWGGFLIVLKNKAKTAGVQFVEVDAKGTSQTCPECGAVAKKKLSQRRHVCPCGYETQRDHAAARVVLARGLGGGGLLPVAVEQTNPVGMPREQSRGGRGGQRKSLAKSVVDKPAKSPRSRKVPPQQEIPWSG